MNKAGALDYDKQYVCNPQTPRANVLGIGISDVEMEDAIRLSDKCIRSSRQAYICTADAHSIVEAQRDHGLARIFNHSLLTLADGMPLVWVAKIEGHKRIKRVYGPDFMLEICRFGISRDYRHFLCGGKPGIADKLRDELIAKVPGLQVVGTYSPPFRLLDCDEEAELAGMIAIAKPDVVWVGLGSPHQDRFIAQYCGLFETNLMIGVGAAFDFHSGAVKEAPRWIRNTGMQWTHRVLQEPRRLWKRYLIGVPSFLWKSGLQITNPSQFPLEMQVGPVTQNLRPAITSTPQN
jgi:N-acetylglucosaminyldiphosphoundecaprenol N-acetyl-beta-D-mannosaminyltransferase